MNRGRLMAVLVMASAGAPAAYGQVPDAQEVIDYLDDLYRSETARAVMTMTVVRRRGNRELTLESWSRGDDEALIVIRSPAREAGTATLRTEDGLWTYAPRADRLIRIPPGLLSESWMGSNFTNDDLLRETSYLDDHTGSVELVRRDGTDVLVLTLVPIEGTPVVYTKLVFEADPETWLPRRSLYYDGDDLVRSMTFEDVRTIAGRRIPVKLTLQPTDEADERTIIVYDVLEFDVALAADLFTQRGLRRAAGH